MGMGDGRKEALSRTIRDSIQASIDQAEADHRRELFKRRLELARQGLAFYRAKKIGEAARAFLTYIKILENWKKVSENGLTPSCFDLKTDAPELLLLSGVYWDLAKLFDRSEAPENLKDFHHYLNQFVVFSKGMNFESLSAETMRKYIRSENPVHKQAFKNAYKKLTGSSCFVATSLVDLIELDTLDSLREFRDHGLAQTFFGRIAARIYYIVGPGLALILDHCPESIRRRVARSLGQFAQSVKDRSNS